MNFSRRLAAVGLVLAGGGGVWNCGADATTTPADDAGTGTDAPGGGDGGGADGSTSDGGGGDTGVDAGEDAGPECNATTPCPGTTLTCCNDRCVDTKKNPSHCGACGVACTMGTQFCNGTACKETTLTNLCQTPNATVILDGITEDDTAGNAIGTAISNCAPVVSVRTVLQSAVQGGPLNIIADSGRPLLGPGDMLVAAGGSFGQDAVDWLESKSSTPIASSQTGTTITFSKRSNGQVLKTLQESDLTPSHDFAIVELTVEPSNGTLTLIAQGLLAPGTRAAAFYLAQVIAPNPATYDQAYYLYEWTDANGNVMPEANEFVLLSSGR